MKAFKGCLLRDIGKNATDDRRNMQVQEDRKLRGSKEWLERELI